MSWVPPAKQFQVGYRTYRVQVCATAVDYLRMHTKHEVEVAQGTTHEKGCTIQAMGLILINEEEHDGDEKLLVHTFFHEMLHACWYAMGRHAAAHHNEIEIDNLAGVLTQAYFTRK